MENTHRVIMKILKSVNNNYYYQGFQEKGVNPSNQVLNTLEIIMYYYFFIPFVGYSPMQAQGPQTQGDYSLILHKWA